MTRLPLKLSAAAIKAVVDTREQHPLDLSPLATEPGTLDVGDYSVRGLEPVITIERKSLADLVACCGRERDRFQRELNRLRGWPIGVVVVESTWRAIDAGGWRGQVTPKQVHASLCSWIAQGHTVVMAHSHGKASQVVRDLLFYAARYRWREAREFVEGVANQ